MPVRSKPSQKNTGSPKKKTGKIVKKATSVKAVAKKTAAKKAKPVKKAAPKKVAPKKVAAKKKAIKKAVPKKAIQKKQAVKKTAPKKTPVKNLVKKNRQSISFQQAEKSDKKVSKQKIRPAASIFEPHPSTAASVAAAVPSATATEHAAHAAVQQLQIPLPGELTHPSAHNGHDQYHSKLQPNSKKKGGIKPSGKKPLW